MARYEYGDEGDPEAEPVIDWEAEPDPRREIGQARHEVHLCSGESLLLLTEQEARWFVDTQTKYLQQNKFTEVTDLQDLDRLLILELSSFRWTQHLAGGVDYDDLPLDVELLRKQIKETSVAITAVKVSLGLDRKARDAALNDGNFHDWTQSLLQRAGQFAVHRQEQLRTALSLMNELSSVVGSFDRSDLEERKKLGFETEKEILAWIRDRMLPTFHEVDAHFVDNEQRLWRRDM